MSINLDEIHRKIDAEHPPLTVGALVEILSKLDPSLPIFTHANNHGANDHMRVALELDPWFRVHTGNDFGKPATLGVRIGNFTPKASQEVLFDFWSRTSHQEGAATD